MPLLARPRSLLSPRVIQLVRRGLDVSTGEPLRTVPLGVRESLIGPGGLRRTLQADSRLLQLRRSYSWPCGSPVRVSCPPFPDSRHGWYHDLEWRRVWRTVGGQSGDSRRTVGRPSGDSWGTVGGQLGDSCGTVG